ncbi:unnamed protein product [Peronospora destructor]|uniref:Sugar transporter SWEET1 n=1 Tax=Peronospora destructor TaxID=86335 RepID=A0AAV0VA73_9STRA|nr:unnamed protein product [Peronospora destructor]
MTESLVVVIVRVLASLAACTLFASLLPDIQVVHRHKSTANMPSALPILSMMANCVAWGLYGVLIDDYFPLVGTNIVGLILSLFYLVVYYYYTTNKGSLSFDILVTTLLLLGLVLYPFMATKDGVKQETIQDIVGFLTVTTSCIMFGSPLILVKRVIQERNTNLLPLTMITTGAVACALWLVYGLLLEDAFIIVPNATNLLLSIVQLGLFCIYPRGSTVDSSTSDDKSAGVKYDDDTEDSTTILKTEDELSSSDEESNCNDSSAQQLAKRETVIAVL